MYYLTPTTKHMTKENTYVYRVLEARSRIPRGRIRPDEMDKLFTLVRVDISGKIYSPHDLGSFTGAQINRLAFLRAFPPLEECDLEDKTTT